MKMNTKKNIEQYLDEVSNDVSLIERILDDIRDSRRLNSGGHKNVVYYLFSEDNTKDDPTCNFWIDNIIDYYHLYIYAMLYNWNEVWNDSILIKNRTANFITSFSYEIEEEIKKFDQKDKTIIPQSILQEIQFIKDVFQWKCKKEVPHFTEEKGNNIASNQSIYNRYINLIKDDSQEDIANNIVKCLEFCLIIDKVSNKSCSLTSFIKYLSGTGENNEDFDTMLKTISAERWGIDSIRQIIINRKEEIPAVLIKLAIYSISIFNREKNTSKADEQSQDTVEYVREIINRASEDINILKNYQNSLEIIDQLRLASFIRDYLVQNEIVTLVCDQESSLGEMRNKNIDEVSKIQYDIIYGLNNNTFSVIYKHKEIKDYPSAKKKLTELVSREIKNISDFIKADHDVSQLCTVFSDHLETCKSIISNCNNDKYVVLLMGEDQSGKTTTLNAFGGGRKIGTIGKGDKTSAVPLALSYADEESVTPIWKEKEDLLEDLSHIQLYMPVDMNKVNIDDAQTRDDLQAKIEIIRRGIEMKEFDLPKGDLQFLALSSIILGFWDSIDLEQLKNKEISINDVPQLTRFPEEMNDRWRKSGLKTFKKIEEVAFVFIKKIECRCPSEVLKEMNGVILDCPGLSASAYDTLVTENAMKEANAILYLFPRAKASGEQIEDSLDKIKKLYPDFHSKLMFANNLQYSDQNSRSILAANRNTVKQKFGDDYELYSYDARNAYLGQIKRSSDLGVLDPYSKNAFVDDHCFIDLHGGKHYYHDFDEAWYVLSQPFKTSEEAINDSEFNKLTSTLVSFIENNKAYSIIISNGLGLLKSELLNIKSHISLSYIEPYLKDKDELEKQWNKREELLLKFESIASQKINEALFESSLEKELSDSIYEKLFSEEFFDSLSKDICNILYDNVKTLKELKDNKEEFEKYTNAIASDRINNMVQQRISFCNGLLYSNQDKDFQKYFIQKIDAFVDNMDIIWDEKFFSNDLLFKGLRSKYYSIPKDTSKFTLSVKELLFDVSTDEENVSSSVMIKKIGEYTGGAIGIGGYGAFFYSCAVSGPIGWIIGGLTLCVGGLYLIVGFDEYSKKRFIKKMSPGLKKQLAEGLGKALRPIISNNIHQLFDQFISDLKVEKKAFSQDKDFSMARKDNPDLESNCFNAVKVMKRIDEQIGLYDHFYSNL